MKKWLTLFLALPLALTLSAQEKFFEEPIGWRGKSIELHTIPDRTKQQYCLFLLNGDSIRVFLMDNKQAIIQHFYVLRTAGEDFLGGFIKDKKIYAYFQNSSGISDLHCWKFDIPGGFGDDYTIPFEMKHERTVEKISCGDHFLFFSVNRKASDFIVYDFHDEKNCDTLHYQFEPKIWKALTTVSGAWGRDMNVMKIDPDGECSPEMAKAPNKIYWLHDTLFLLMNHYERGVTSIFSFDVRGKQVNFRKIVHNNAITLNMEEDNYEDNSMLLDDKLYFISAENNKLNLQIRDFHSGKMLREYTAAKDQDISFKNTPIIQEGGAYSGHGTRELDKTRQLLRKMLSGSALIIASREDSGRVGLTVGSYKKLNNNGMGFGPMFAVGAATGVFINLTATMGVFRHSWTKSARFKSYVDSATGEHLPGEIVTDIVEKIEAFTDGISIPPEGENLFRLNGRYVYAYYNRDEHKLMLANF